MYRNKPEGLNKTMFDSEKTYTIHVWNMPVLDRTRPAELCVVDDETGDFIRNEDGSIKLFQIPKYDFSHICDGIDVDDLYEYDKENDHADA